MDNPAIKLLLVDDEPSIRISLALILTQLGFTVRTAHDGFSGLASMMAELPDIVLSDLNMPGMSGMEFLSSVRSRFPDVPAIAMSGAYASGAPPDGVAAQAFYAKGQGVISLVSLLRSFCAGPRAAL